MPEKNIGIYKIKIEFAAGTEYCDAMSYIWELFNKTDAEIETVFNGIHVRVTNNDFRKIIEDKQMHEELTKEAEKLLESNISINEPWFIVPQPWADDGLLFIVANEEDPHIGDFVCSFECDVEDIDDPKDAADAVILQERRASLAVKAPYMQDLIQRLTAALKEQQEAWRPIDARAMTGDYILVKHNLPYSDKRPYVTVFDSERQKFDMGSLRQPDLYCLIPPGDK